MKLTTWYADPQPWDNWQFYLDAAKVLAVTDWKSYRFISTIGGNYHPYVCESLREVLTQLVRETQSPSWSAMLKDLGPETTED